MSAHAHAELIKQMVDDDTLRATCEYANGECRIDVVTTYPNYPWRLVPPKPKTITIVANGKTYELPEPMRVAPKLDTEYCIVTSSGDVEEQNWDDGSSDKRWLRAGICHATREAAQQWVDAMAEIRGAK